MPTHLRYERVPVWEEGMSDASSSSSSTPQHLARAERSVASMTAAMEEEQQMRTTASGNEANGRDAVTNDAATNNAAKVSTTAVHDASNSSSGGVGVSHPCGYAAIPPSDNYGPPVLDLSAPPPYTECDDLTTTDVMLNMPTNAAIIASHNNTELEGTLVCGVSEMASLELQDGGVVMQPPSYEEVQRIKAVEAQLETGDHILLPPHTGNHLGLSLGGVVSGDGGEGGEPHPGEEDLLGTDLIFFLAFAAAFFFNWVGFVLLVCFCHSVAGRSGALAGFGLSLAKWAVIVRHSTVLAKEANTWLLWLIMVLGLMICMRAVLQYLNAKREWQHASAASRHRFLLFH